MYMTKQINDEFINEVKQWALEFYLKKLMQVFNKRLSKKLPGHSRTLLETPFTIKVRKIGDNRLYWYQGLLE